MGYRTYRPFKPYRERPLCFLDVEGTSTDTKRAEITEIGLRHSKKGAINIQVMPSDLGNADPESLKISRFNERDWSGAPNFKKAIPMFIDYIEDATIVGHNIYGYDMPLFQNEFDRLGVDRSNLFRDIVDTMSLARIFLVPLGLKRIGLESCMKFIGEPYKDAHNAHSDAYFSEKLYGYIMENVKWHGKIDGRNIQESLF